MDVYTLLCISDVNTVSNITAEFYMMVYIRKFVDEAHTTDINYGIETLELFMTHVIKPYLTNRGSLTKMTNGTTFVGEQLNTLCDKIIEISQSMIGQQWIQQAPQQASRDIYMENYIDLLKTAVHIFSKKATEFAIQSVTLLQALPQLTQAEIDTFNLVISVFGKAAKEIATDIDNLQGSVSGAAAATPSTPTPSTPTLDAVNLAAIQPLSIASTRQEIIQAKDNIMAIVKIIKTAATSTASSAQTPLDKIIGNLTTVAT
jgi:hypothetical protein